MNAGVGKSVSILIGISQIQKINPSPNISLNPKILRNRSRYVISHDFDKIRLRAQQMIQTREILLPLEYTVKHQVNPRDLVEKKNNEKIEEMIRFTSPL